ncbi:MAG: hypothetical protein JNL67_12890 [Planctomycetaceae bacterium]|nr:hypothetical protein [Planctomycetaceae bacterium]
MMSMFSVIGLVSLLFAPTIQDVESRTWKAGSSEYSIKGVLVAYNDNTVVLKRDRSEKLVAVEIAELSEPDQKFVADKREKDKQDAAESPAEDWHTWTSQAGWQIRGRVLAYGRKDLVIDRKSGVVTINGKAFSSLDVLQQKLVLAVLSKLEGKAIENEADVRALTGSSKGEPKQYTLDGVMLELESKDHVPVPFFMFSEKDLELLRSGWEAWLAAEQDAEARAREDFLVRQEAMQYQRMQHRKMQHEQMEILKLNLLASAAGVTTIWEVALLPAPGTRGRPMTVVVSAPNSQAAAQVAVQQHRGFVAGPIRKVSNN